MSLIKGAMAAVDAAIDAAEARGFVIWSIEIELRDDDATRGQYAINLMVGDPEKHDFGWDAPDKDEVQS